MNTRAKVITVAQQKGGAGKTTLAANLAICLQQKGNKVAAVDIDPQESFTRWHDVREKKFGKDFTGIKFLTLPGWKIESEILNLENDYDYIIVDTPPRIEVDSKSAIRRSNLVIIPMQPSPMDLWATNGCSEFAENEKVPYRVLLNRVNSSSKILSKIIKQIPHPMKTILGNRVAFASSTLEGKSITESNPSSTGAQEMKNLTNEVIKLVNIKPFKKAA